MTKNQLIAWSGVRDFLDIIVIGQIPGLNWLFDIPLLVMHLNYAGPKALFTLLEAIPGLGFMPIWTIAAMTYPDHNPSPPVPAIMQAPTLYIPPLPDNAQVRKVDSRVVDERSDWHRIA